ncbi:hypothetical protein [Methylibium sp.]|uniref:hypothetical protein n=1 Tax=Methylibium sp. TaxID=2067992 RepID=UPI001827A03B|nr:hypothetical protein [Methylibium sp.]MBA3588486.1 hypothetical protein [Methylibium sp.]
MTAKPTAKKPKPLDKMAWMVLYTSGSETADDRTFISEAAARAKAALWSSYRGRFRFVRVRIQEVRRAAK